MEQPAEEAPKSTSNLPVAGAEKKKGKLAAAKRSAAKTASEIAAKTKAASKVAVNAMKPAFQKISSKATGIVQKAKGLFNSV